MRIGVLFALSAHTDASRSLYPYLLAELRSGSVSIEQVEPLLNSWVALAMPNYRTPVFEDSLMATAPADITAFAPLSPNGAQYTWLWDKAHPSAPYSRPYLPIIFFDQSVATPARAPPCPGFATPGPARCVAATRRCGTTRPNAS